LPDYQMAMIPALTFDLIFILVFLLLDIDVKS
jgi:hypothetical protein